MEILDQKRTGRSIRMYSAEQRAKGIETFARFGCSAADTMAELGYPSCVPLCNWWKEYQISGDGFLEKGASQAEVFRRGEAGHGRSLPGVRKKPSAHDKGHGVPDPRGARQLGRRAYPGALRCVREGVTRALRGGIVLLSAIVFSSMLRMPYHQAYCGGWGGL